jgi:hypothetical protein
MIPPDLIPRLFTHVSSQTAASPVAAAAKALDERIGKKVLSALTKDTVMAALVHQMEIQ